MNIKKLIDGNYLNATIVNGEKQYNAIIINSGIVKPNKEGQEKLELLVEYNGRQLIYSPNKQSMVNLSQKWGLDTIQWVGKMFVIRIQTMSNGKEGIIAETLGQTHQN